jgi:hypothetical protein
MYRILAAIAALVLLAGCGGEATRDNAVDAQEPAPDSAADRTFDGAALVFEVPFESTAERPMVLEIAGPTGSGAARIQLDL